MNQRDVVTMCLKRRQVAHWFTTKTMLEYTNRGR